MNVEIQVDERCVTPTIVIRTAAITPEIADLVRKLSTDPSQAITGYQGDEIYLLSPQDIVRIDTQEQRVVAHTEKDAFLLRSRLYELEEQLAPCGFIRISHSEIINFSWVQSLDVSISGTISLRLKNGDKSFVSRRHVDQIKQHIGL